MKITIKATGVQLSESIYQYIQAKIDTLDKFVQNVGDDKGGDNPPIECWVELENTTEHHQKGDIFRAEAQMKLPGVSGVRAESSEWDLHQAIDKVKDELQRQLKRYKRKMAAKRRR